jgi:hypothetical protein
MQVRVFHAAQGLQHSSVVNAARRSTLPLAVAGRGPCRFGGNRRRRLSGVAVRGWPAKAEHWQAFVSEQRN